MMEALEKAEEKVGESSRAEGKGDEDKNAAGDDDLRCPICMDFFIDVRAAVHPLPNFLPRSTKQRSCDAHANLHAQRSFN